MTSRCFRCGSKAGTLNQVRMVLKATKLCTCRMLAATGWKLEYIPRVTSFQSEGEMTYRPRDGRPGVIQFEDAEKMKYHPHHPPQFIEKNTFFGKFWYERGQGLQVWLLLFCWWKGLTWLTFGGDTVRSPAGTYDPCSIRRVICLGLGWWSL